MSVLFSPIGTADPATQLGDGPMMHIVRHMRPNAVMLFLSPKMAQYEQSDGRYTKAIEYVARAAGFAQPSVECMLSEHDEVHRFDPYIEEMEKPLNRLLAEYPGEDVLVNVTSGTPAMQQALVALGSFGRLPLQMLQVSTPRKDANRRYDREDPENYDLGLMLELSEMAEAERGYESRIIEVKSPNFFSRVQRENIASLVEHFEYGAAYELAMQTDLISNEVKEMILATAERLNLNGQRSARVFGGTTLAWKADDQLSEYLASMEVRLMQGHWADFLRAMTPAFTEIMKVVLRQSGLLEEKYMTKMRGKRGKPTFKLDPRKINGDPRLQKAVGGSIDKPKYPTNYLYSSLVEEYCEDREVCNRVAALREMEDECRNMLAHEMKRADKERLEKAGGMTLDDVLEAFIFLHDWITPKKMERGLYKRISTKIVESM